MPMLLPVRASGFLAGLRRLLLFRRNIIVPSHRSIFIVRTGVASATFRFLVFHRVVVLVGMVCILVSTEVNRCHTAALLCSVCVCVLRSSKKQKTTTTDGIIHIMSHHHHLHRVMCVL